MILQNIKKICEEKGLSIAQLEKAAGLSNGAICKWNISIPKVDKLKMVADYLEVTVDELIRDNPAERKATEHIQRLLKENYSDDKAKLNITYKK